MGREARTQRTGVKRWGKAGGRMVSKEASDAETYDVILC